MIMKANFCFVMVIAIWVPSQQMNSFKRFLDFLSNNPNEVLLIDLQDESNGRSAKAFITGKPSVHGDSDLESWPTLAELIQAEKRVLLFGSPTDNDPEWLLSKSDWWYSNGWYYQEPEDLDCGIGRR